jgi:hypothetical protein
VFFFKNVELKAFLTETGVAKKLILLKIQDLSFFTLLYDDHDVNRNYIHLKVSVCIPISLNLNYNNTSIII